MEKIKIMSFDALSEFGSGSDENDQLEEGIESSDMKLKEYC